MDPIPKLSKYIWPLPLFVVRDFPENVFIKVPKIAGMVRRTIPVLFETLMKTFSGKSLTKHEGKDHLNLENLGMGSIYVIKSIFSRDRGPEKQIVWCASKNQDSQ